MRAHDIAPYLDHRNLLTCLFRTLKLLDEERGETKSFSVGYVHNAGSGDHRDDFECDVDILSICTWYLNVRWPSGYMIEVGQSKWKRNKTK